MKKLSDKTKRTVYKVLFGCVTLIFIAAFVVGLVGIIKKAYDLIRLSIIFISCGLIINIFNILIFKSSNTGEA